MDMYKKMGVSKKSAKPGDLIAAAAKKQAMKKKAKKTKPMSYAPSMTRSNRPMDGSTDEHMAPMMKKKAMKKKAHKTSCKCKSCAK